jgi:HrpA-like RNA helicase
MKNRDEFLEAGYDHQVFVIVGEIGSGRLHGFLNIFVKPVTLNMEELLLVLQPCRVAAMNIVARKITIS